MRKSHTHWSQKERSSGGWGRKQFAIYLSLRQLSGSLSTHPHPLIWHLYFVRKEQKEWKRLGVLVRNHYTLCLDTSGESAYVLPSHQQNRKGINRAIQLNFCGRDLLLGTTSYTASVYILYSFMALHRSWKYQI